MAVCPYCSSELDDNELDKVSVAKSEGNSICPLCVMPFPDDNNELIDFNNE